MAAMALKAIALVMLGRIVDVSGARIFDNTDRRQSVADHANAGNEKAIKDNATEQFLSDASSSTSVGLFCPSGLNLPLELPPINTEACHNPLDGSLVVGCVWANGLKDADGWGKSDPYCQVRLTDAMHTEVQGGYHEFVPRSSSFTTRYRQGNLNPTWQEAFEFTALCPEHPDAKNTHKYQIEVTIKDSDATNADDMLGNVYIPIDDAMSGKISGTREFTLQQNLADSTDTRHVQGTVTLHVKWCPLNSRGCIDEAARASGTRETQKTLVQCGMSCGSKLRPKIDSRINDILSRMNDAKEDYANARVARSNPDAGVGTPEDLESQGDRKWQRASEKVARLDGSLKRAASAACGKAIVDAVSEILWESGPWGRVVNRFSDSRADKWILKLNRLRGQLTGVTDCLNAKWKAGKFLPAPNTLTSECAAYYEGHINNYDCTCTDGLAAYGTACTGHGGEVCTSCNAGYRLQGTECTANICSCMGGTAATGAACSLAGNAICASCFAGYRMNGIACEAVNPNPRGVPPYTKEVGKHCGGTAIEQWPDGSTAEYGRTDLTIDQCKIECTSHASVCAGFVYRTRTLR